MKARIRLVASAIATMAVAIATLVGLGAFAVPAQAVTIGDGSGGCTVTSNGYMTHVGLKGAQERWTENFPSNSCGLPVRARVKCGYMNSVWGTYYGSIIHGTGNSWYTCPIIENVISGNGQVKVSGVWKNLPH